MKYHPLPLSKEGLLASALLNDLYEPFPGTEVKIKLKSLIK